MLGYVLQTCSFLAQLFPSAFCCGDHALPCVTAIGLSDRTQWRNFLFTAVPLLPMQANGEERDILQAEQTEVPDEVFAEQPSSLGGALPDSAHAAWDAAAQVASKAKGLFVGGGRTTD